MTRVLGHLMAWYVRLLARTCRIEPIPRDQVVLAFWHGANLAAFAAAFRHRRGVPHASFTTAGPRGTVIATTFEALPTPTIVLILPEERDRQGARALAMRLARLAEEGYSPVVTPDGPFGPYRQAKPGALMLARAAGIPILPLGISARPAIRLRRWDRHIVPLPFSRIRVVVGEPIAIGPREAVRGRIAELEAALNRVADLAEGGIDPAADALG